MEPEGSIPNSQELSTYSFPEPHQSSPHHPHPTSPRSILILSTHLSLRIPSGLFPSGFPTNNLYVFHFFNHSCYMTRTSHPLRLHYDNYTWRRVQITKLLVMQFSPFSRHLIPLRSKYPPQHLVLKHPQSCSSLTVRDQVSQLYRTTGKIIFLYILIVIFLDSRREDRRFWTEW
jgi:hypothetical protein